jgi:hypothetical protein
MEAPDKPMSIGMATTNGRIEHGPLARSNRMCYRFHSSQRRVLHSAGITDAGLAHLKGLIHLSSLELANTPVSDDGSTHLKGLTKLVFLSLNNTQVSDASLAHLKGFSDLSILCLGKTQLTDAGLAHLSGMTKLSHVNLHGTLWFTLNATVDAWDIIQGGTRWGGPMAIRFRCE